MTLEQLIDQLSEIEPKESMFDGIGPSEVKLLDRLVRHPDWMASRAISAARRVHDPEATALLQRAAKDLRPEVRIAVAASLSKVSNLEPADMDDMLVTLLSDNDLGVQKCATRAVGKNHGEKVCEKLMSLKGTTINALVTNKLRELGIE